MTPTRRPTGKGNLEWPFCVALGKVSLELLQNTAWNRQSIIYYQCSVDFHRDSIFMKFPSYIINIGLASHVKF